MTSSRFDVKVLYFVTVSGFSFARDSSVPFIFLQCGPLGWKPPDHTTVPSRQGPGDKAVTCSLQGPAVTSPQALHALPHPAPGLLSCFGLGLCSPGRSCPGVQLPRHTARPLGGASATWALRGQVPPSSLLAQTLSMPPLPHCISGAGDREPRSISSLHLAPEHTGW